jgi:23S rRNA (adenine2503-C2)-methyltransferase
MHAVFMGMGEPMLNLPAVVQAVEVINKHVGIGARHITISTVGVRGQLPLLAQHKLQCLVAVSLHAPNQRLR